MSSDTLNMTSELFGVVASIEPFRREQTGSFGRPRPHGQAGNLSCRNLKGDAWSKAALEVNLEKNSDTRADFGICHEYSTLILTWHA